MAGYSIEFALKALYSKDVPAQSYPPERTTYNKLYAHNLNDLLEVSGIKEKLNEEGKREINWQVIKDWNEKSRYEVKSRKDAQSLYDAVTNSEGAVLKWIKKIW